MPSLSQPLASIDSTGRPHPGTEGLVEATPGTKDLATTSGAQQLPVQQPIPGSGNINYFLSLIEWEKKDEDRLLQSLNLAILNIQEEITVQDDFNHFLTEIPKDVANKNQPLPYFARETWPRNIFLEINSRNISGANPQYRLDLLPTERNPDKFFREEFKQFDKSSNYGLIEYLNDPPFYDMTTYSYEAGVIQIMTQQDCCRFLDLTYLRLPLVEDYMPRADSATPPRGAPRQRRSDRSISQGVTARSSGI